MGAWGPGNFENDTVLDWLADVDSWQSVVDALFAILRTPADRVLDASSCCVALGAAEIVAACLGRPGRLPQRAVEVVAAVRQECDESARDAAARCVRRIEKESELQSLFDEGGRYEKWHSVLEELVARLS
ncbi:MAG: DUF4259 domain-containing protein [Deltaproteobacteria bacterium]|nr:DUF4259 domain-containing protein [Kofleriaceae bacterium]